MEKIKVKHPYIEVNKKICGGSPVIKGTRIRVIDIVIEYEYMGLSPDEILEAHPHLKLEHIHDALSFYYENREKIDKEIKERIKKIKKMEKKYPSKLKEWLK